ncbi:DUF2069 domain-containing protein [Elongatibacter sediminis]|uniref:DUF2069 domain-containing protein n=1 Tax=Elongatibacter sediminis TaxID=3119006 RepID=A0AAW9RHT9_9GAMM
MSGARGVILSWLALLGWQPVWLLVLPPPHGPRNLVLAAVATAPLLIPLAGILRARMRAMTWGGFISVAYFVAGVTELWSNPPMRPAAGVEVLLALAYVLLLARHAKSLRTGKP